jgi:hypothetical protein
MSSGERTPLLQYWYMDFLDPVKRKHHMIRLFIGYALVGFLVVFSTVTIVYYSTGFGITRGGEVVQNGLVFVSSQPAGAELYVDGERKDNTNAKLTLPDGTYTFKIQKSGYQTWEKRVEVVGGAVDHVVYPLLIPTDLTTTELTSFVATPTLFTQSPDRKWIVTQEAGQDAAFTLYDAGRNVDEIVAERQAITLPTGLVTASESPAAWKLVEWSTNNRHMLLERTFTAAGASNQEYILVDTQRVEGSYNLTRELALAPTAELTLRDKQPTDYYVLDSASKQLSTTNLDSKVLATVASGVLAYKSHGNNDLLYITEQDAPSGSVNARARIGGKAYTVRTLARTDSYALDMARYENKWYITFGSVQDGRLYIYENPVEQIIASSESKASPLFAMRLEGVTQLKFSATAQFVGAQNGSRFQVFDIKHGRGYSYAAPFAFDAGAERQYAEWMDGHRYLYASAGNAQLLEYDGTNRRQLMLVSGQSEVFFDRDYRAAFALAPRADGQPGVGLTVTSLLIEADQSTGFFN